MLGLHFGLTLYHFALAAGLRTDAWPRVAAVANTVGSFSSANRYTLYARVHPAHVQVEFEGSNDGGRTWRAYEYRHLPQATDRAPPFVAPWFPRIENTLLFEGERPPQPSVITSMASQLLRENPVIVARFRRDPFPDSPPTVIRMRRYRYGFTTLSTLRRTGEYWRKEDAGEYLPPLYRTGAGDIGHFDLTAADQALSRGNVAAAMAEYERQYRRGYAEAGFRLADLYARGQGQAAQPEKMFALISELADSGEVRALHNLGLCHEHGVGVAADRRQALALYRRAAERGYVLSMVAFGALAALESVSAAESTHAYSLLLTAARRATGNDAAAQYVRREIGAPMQVLRSRLGPSDIAEAEREAKARR